MTPKSLLRLPEARSSFDDMVEGTTFQRIIPEAGVATQNPLAVKKVVFCSGKIYYDILRERQKMEMDESIAICRIEQISPFPFDLIKAEILKYPRASIAFCQEEHKNQGAWFYAEPRLRTVMRKINEQDPHFSVKDVTYIGREPSASTATGNKSRHLQEWSYILNETVRI